jgi:Rod binding domain-containing protein
MAMIPVGNVGIKPLAPTAGTTGVEDVGKLKKAAEDFEGMLIGQMLQSIRDSALGGWQEEKDQTGAIALEMAESQIARAMASSGGLGLARTLEVAMAHRNSPPPPKPAVKGSGS